MMKLFDSHAHYFDNRYEEEGIDVYSLLDALFSDNVGYIVNVATNNTNAIACTGMAEKYNNMYTALGIHPSDINPASDIDDELATLTYLLKKPESKAVALGEIGLDYHFEPYDKDLQMRYFDEQLTLAGELGIPAVIHIRDAHGDAFDTIMKHKNAYGIIHSYSGSPEMAKEYVRHGWYISFSGTLTFKNASKVQQSAMELPRDMVLIETDSPYLAPHPFRGRINNSSYLLYTAEKLGSIWGISTEEAAKITSDNAKRLFGIK